MFADSEMARRAGDESLLPHVSGDTRPSPARGVASVALAQARHVKAMRSTSPARTGYCVAKRGLDLLGASLLLGAAAPVMVAVAGCIAVTMGRPLFFYQRRPGRWARPFIVRKFRTMRSLRAGERLVADDGARLTRLGRFLRATSLDELPTLFSVVSGDMSLVGPRPLLETYVERYSAEQARRHLVRPGITGWAQINGRNDVTWEEKLAMDVWYVDNASVFLDLRILARTVGKVVRREGVALEGTSTTVEFMGSVREEGAVR